ncbi:hypothetical protein FHX69_4084 [Prauserella muralis]|nr:hypothetical protein FHX69_4084 [Prauserella muralis]
MNGERFHPAPAVDRRAVGYPAAVSILETTLVFAAIPLAIYAVCALLTLRSKFAGRPRYRPGQAWEYPPMWWTGSRDGAGEPQADGEPAGASKVRGGARGSW